MQLGKTLYLESTISHDPPILVNPTIAWHSGFDTYHQKKVSLSTDTLYINYGDDVVGGKQFITNKKLTNTLDYYKIIYREFA